MDLCINDGNKCDKQMFVTRTADSNLKSGHDGLNSREREIKRIKLIFCWPWLRSGHTLFGLVFKKTQPHVVVFSETFSCRNLSLWKEKEKKMQKLGFTLKIKLPLWLSQIFSLSPLLQRFESLHISPTPPFICCFVEIFCISWSPFCPTCLIPTVV